MSVIFKALGVNQGDCVHIVVGNHHYSFLAAFAAWHLGAYSSTGDILLEEEAIAGQVLCSSL